MNLRIKYYQNLTFQNIILKNDFIQPQWKYGFFTISGAGSTLSPAPDAHASHMTTWWRDLHALLTNALKRVPSSDLLTPNDVLEPAGPSHNNENLNWITAWITTIWVNVDNMMLLAVNELIKKKNTYSIDWLVGPWAVTCYMFLVHVTVTCHRYTSAACACVIVKFISYLTSLGYVWGGIGGGGRVRVTQ